jgi:hypothetical protein
MYISNEITHFPSAESFSFSCSTCSLVYVAVEISKRIFFARELEEKGKKEKKKEQKGFFFRSVCLSFVLLIRKPNLPRLSIAG